MDARDRMREARFLVSPRFCSKILRLLFVELIRQTDAKVFKKYSQMSCK